MDLPELTDEQLKSARPMGEADPEFLFHLAVEKKRRGWPVGRTKEAARISLDRDVGQAP